MHICQLRRPTAILFTVWSCSLYVIFFPTNQIFAAKTRPNVMVIVADDLGWSGVGFHSKEMTTPNLDKMAKEGVELSRFYVYPVCSPTRIALLSGQMPRRFNVLNALNGQAPGLPQNIPTISSTFKAAGYQTSLIGKWHVGKATTPQDNGFDHFYGFMNAEIDYQTHNGKGGRLDWQRDGKDVVEEGYSTYLFADEAVKQIRARDKSRPFYMQLTFNAPHDPLSAPAKLIEKHQAKGAKLGLYAAVVDAMDEGIGRVLNAVDDEQIQDNTLVVFFSDNGASGREGGSNAPLRMGKGTLYEGGIHTPSLLRWTGQISPGVVLNQPISVQDLFPTITDAVGVPIPGIARLDGVSQWEAIKSSKRIQREPFLVASFDTAVIDGDWKLLEFEDNKRALYDLKHDISETKDLAESRPDIVEKLRQKSEKLRSDLPPITAERNGPMRAKLPKK